MELVIILVVFLQFILYRLQSKRITDLERIIKEFKAPLPQTKEPISMEMANLSHNEPKKVIPPPFQPKQPTQKLSKRTIKAPIITLIKDNWIGVVGALAIVLGGVFFSLTAEIMQNPPARIGALLIFSLILVAISFKLKKKKKWIPLSSYLTSIAGAITLFASFGAGAIDGLLCIHHPIKALAFLCLGIGVNLFLSLKSPSQFIASFHVILSLMTLCMVPQTQYMILIGAIVSAAGLIACFRYKWELHLSLIIVMFSVQNALYSLQGGSTSPFLPIIASLLVGCSAGMVHYKKAYKQPHFALIPFSIHLLNWGLLSWNLLLYAKLGSFTPIALAGMSTALFILAQVAKRKEIIWLFHTDTILAQLIAVVAFISLVQFPIKLIDIILLILTEILLFNSICNLQKEKILVKSGHLLQWMANATAVYLFIYSDLQHDALFYLRGGAIVLMNWGYHYIACSKSFIKDTFTFFFNLPFLPKNAKSLQFVVSPSLLSGVIFLSIGAFYSTFSILIPACITFFIWGLALWKKKNPLPELDCTLFFSLISLHSLYWGNLMTSSSPVMGNLMWIGLLDAALIFGKYLHSHLFKNGLYCIATYGFAMHWIFMTYFFTKNTHPLIPATLYLIYSLIALEFSKLKYLKDISHFLFQVGFLCILSFLTNFIFIHFQVYFVWKGIFIRGLIESLALLALGYWFFYPPKNFTISRISAKLHGSLVEIFIGFLTLSIFAECPENWRALSWALLALTFSAIPKYPSTLKRLYLYSWAFLIGSIVNTAFLTHYQTYIDRLTLKAHLPAFLSIAIQIAYSILSFKQKRKDNMTKNLYRQLFQSPSLSILLPIFIGIALLLFFNFEKAILTLLWVGLTCLYSIISLVVKSKRAMQISLGALAICSLRLVIFDLTQQSLSNRALVFLGVGSLMLVMSILYNKFKHRLELNEDI